MRKHCRKGITLIEMVSIIVVLGLSVPVLLTMWADVAWRTSRSELIADAIFYTQQLTEEIKSYRFDENSSGTCGAGYCASASSTKCWTCRSSLGPEGGEAYPNYDDVDDFRSYSDTPAPRYTRSAVVEYVYLDTGDNTWKTYTGANCTDFKRVTVTVSRTDNIVRDIKLVTVISGL